MDIKRQFGVTFIELIVVVAILALLMIAATVALDPSSLINRGGDATRKKDLRRISIAFEEYMNDKGCYPDQVLIDSLNADYCGKSNEQFFPQLKPWPCDPRGGVYTILVEDSDCPHWFMLFTNLKNQSDKDISSKTMGKLYNYCVSSTNIDCYINNIEGRVLGGSGGGGATPTSCVPVPQPCFSIAGTCQHLGVGEPCVAPNCFSDDRCTNRVCSCN